MHLASDGTGIAARTSERVAGGRNSPAKRMLMQSLHCSRRTARPGCGSPHPGRFFSGRASASPRSRPRCCACGRAPRSRRAGRAGCRRAIAEKASAAPPSSATPIRMPGISRRVGARAGDDRGRRARGGGRRGRGRSGRRDRRGRLRCRPRAARPAPGSAPPSSGGSVPSSGGIAPPSSSVPVVRVGQRAGVGRRRGSGSRSRRGGRRGGRRRRRLVLAAVVVVALDAGLERLAEVREVAVEVGLDRVQRLLQVVARVVADVDHAVAAVVGVDRLDLLRRVGRRLGLAVVLWRRSRSESASGSARMTRQVRRPGAPARPTGP